MNRMTTYESYDGVNFALRALSSNRRESIFRNSSERSLRQFGNGQRRPLRMRDGAIIYKRAGALGCETSIEAA
jgi:hypothetical protein